MPSRSGPGRTAKIWSLITGCAAGDAVSIRHLCAACVAAVGVDGAAVWLATDLDRRALLHATDDVARELDDAHFTLGEGPSAQAWRERGMVLAAELASPASAAQWPLFAPAAISAGARAIFAFPLQAGAIRIGGLGLYRATPGPLSGEQRADALAFSVAAFTLALDLARPAVAADADVDVDVDADADADGGSSMRSAHSERLADGLADGSAKVYQATGMVAVQLGVRLDVALLRLRAHAFTHGMGIAEVARQVVDRRLRFSVEDR